MSLNEQDLEAIGRLMDQKLAVVQVQDRRRRRFWFWFWMVVLVVSSVATWWLYVRLKDQVDGWVAERNEEFTETKLTYQRQLALSQKLRDERAKAEHVVAYDSTKTQATHEADLMGGLLSLIGSQAAFKQKFDNADISDPEVLEAYLKNFQEVLDKGLKPMATVVLRNTDPAHNSPDEKLRASDGQVAPQSVLGGEPEATSVETPAAVPPLELTPAQ